MSPHNNKTGFLLICVFGNCRKDTSLNYMIGNRNIEVFIGFFSYKLQFSFLFCFIFRTNVGVDNMQKAYIIPHHTAYLDCMCQSMPGNMSKIPWHNYKLCHGILLMLPGMLWHMQSR